MSGSLAGRFLQQDPLPPRWKEMNAYVYVSNNPLNLVDPMGRDSCGKCYEVKCDFGGIASCLKRRAVNINPMVLYNLVACWASNGWNLRSCYTAFGSIGINIGECITSNCDLLEIPCPPEGPYTGQ
jgi:hypothetical protein